MKLRDILANIDKSSPQWVDIDDLFDEFQLTRPYSADIPDVGFNEYAFGTWTCTDTAVGFSAIFLGDEPVAMVYQSSRKADRRIFWLSKEARAKVRQILLEIIDNASDDDNATFVNLDDDMKDGFHVSFGPQIGSGVDVIVTETKERAKITKVFQKEIKMWQIVEIQKEDGTNSRVDISTLTIPWQLAKA